MKTLTSVLAATAFAAGLLSGCGGDDGAGGGGNYCDSVESIQKDFTNFGAGDVSDFEAFTDKVAEFADDAPDEVRDDWKVLDEAFSAFADALEEAGMEPEDLASAASGQIPEGVDPEAFSEAMTAAQGLTSDDVVKALEGIQKHAKDECNLEFEGA